MADSAFLRQMHSRFSTPRSHVVAVVRRNSGRDVESLRRIVNGYDNEVYLAEMGGGGRLYVRIRRRGEGDFSGEAWAMGLACDAGVPVPEVVGLDRVSSDDAERDVMVVKAASGHDMESVDDDLSKSDRHDALADLGGILARLHAVRMPGAWRPDAGRWPSPDELRQYFVRDRLAERGSLVRAGLSSVEIDRTYQVLEERPPLESPEPVLCHGDLAPGHVFLDDRRRVTCLIDWGMWHAGSSLGELAYVWTTFGDDGLNSVLSGSHVGSMTDPEFRRSIAVVLCQQQIGHIAHRVSIDDEQGIQRNVGFLRRALAELV